MAEPLIEGRGLVVAYEARQGVNRAKGQPAPVLHGVDITIARGEVVGIVGESGSGKSTLGRALLGLVRPTAGKVTFDGFDITGFDRMQMRPLRRRMQMIFQDPATALNPRRRIVHALIEPLLLHGLASGKRAAEQEAALLLQKVGLSPSVLARYPHELSGGQRQRIGIARAVVLKPDFVLADEIVSGLDASTRAQVLLLLSDLRGEMGLSIAFISHDLAVVRAICERVYVLSRGAVVEEGSCDDVFERPRHPYTRALIDAIPLPVPDPDWLDTP